jgi:hypothetical protein
MAIVAVARTFDVGRNLAIMTPQKHFARARLAPVTDKALDELAYRRSGDKGGVGNDGGLDSAERRRIPFVLATAALFLREKFSRRACKVNP